MRAALIRMPFLEQEYVKFSEKWEYIEDEYIGVGIVEAILRRYGAEVFLFDALAKTTLLEEISAINPDVVMVSVMQTSALRTFNFVNSLRERGFTGKIFIGGWFAKMAWREIFIHQWPVDYVCFVDAEVVLPCWLQNPNEDIYGIATYNNWQEQKILLPSQNFMLQNYVSPCRRGGRRTYSLEMSRGCPHSRCTFCSQSCGNVLISKWMPFPVETIRKEIISLHDRFCVTRFATSDDDLLGPEKNALNRAKEIYEMVQSLPFPITFSASISVRSACSEEILDTLQAAGLEQLCIGFESADERQLRRYGKQQSLEENFKAAELLSRRDLRVLPGLITFDPYSTVESIRKNLDFLFDNLNHYNISKLTKRLHLLTGSPFVKMCQKDNLLVGNYLEYDYDFQNVKIDRIYKSFEAYVHMVKDIESTIKNKGKQYEKILGNHHRKVAEYILRNCDIDETVLNEVQMLKRDVGMM